MSVLDSGMTPESVRDAWLGFQGEALTVKRLHSGVAMALPQTFPDGWQMVVELLPGPPGKAKLSDGGRTLGWLAARGQNVETPTIKERLRGIFAETRILQDGWDLFCWIDLPIQGVDMHVFAEGLGTIAHLYLLHEGKQRTTEAADRTLRQVFQDRELVVREKHRLHGQTERVIRVDYFLQTTRPVAIQVLRRQGSIMALMEQWGYRWQDLRKKNLGLVPVMVYDPAVQEVDEASEAIGREVCDLFCPYDETDRIHDLLQAAQN